MNKTNFLHAAYAVAMMLPFVLVDLPEAGAAFAIAWFVSREHAHRQNDIADTTYVSVTKQNPLDGFRGWSLDAKLDVLFPAVAVMIILGVSYGYGF
jgi:hypothetical protein